MDIKSKCSWASELDSKGYDVALITPSEDVGGDAASAVFRLPELTTDQTISFADIEKRYVIPSLKHLQTTEIAYFSLTRNEARERTRSLITAFENIFDEHSFAYCVQGRGGELHRLLLHYYVNATGGTSIWQGFAFFEETFSLHTRLDGQWDDYSTIPYAEIPADGREWASAYIEDFRDRRKFFSLTDDEDRDERHLERGKRLIRIFDERLLNRKQPGRPRNVTRRFVKEAGKAMFNKRIGNSITESERLCEDEQYVLYLVQFPAESRLTVFSPEFYDQRSIIRYLVHILPDAVKLFIKPHPHHPGILSPLYTHNLNSHCDVEFLHPSMHPHDAIKRAEAVVSINNTPGFESILYGTPLLNLGKAFYTRTPAARHIDSLSDLPEEIANSIGTEIPEKQIVESVYSIRQSAYDGDVGSSNPEDVVDCVDSLLDFVEAFEQ